MKRTIDATNKNFEKVYVSDARGNPIWNVVWFNPYTKMVGISPCFLTNIQQDGASFTGVNPARDAKGETPVARVKIAGAVLRHKIYGSIIQGYTLKKILNNEVVI